VAELGPDAIVYENGGVLHEFNLASSKTRNLPIVVRAEDVEARPNSRASRSPSEATRFLLRRRARWWRLAAIFSRYQPNTAAFER